MITTTGRTAAEAWLAALTASSQRLRELVEVLPGAELKQSSFAADWSVAQVLSHLGSAAEICTRLVERELAADLTGPQRDEVARVWQRWDAMTPEQQRAEWVLADARHVQLLRSITDEQAETMRVPYFAGPLRLADYVGYRLSEQSVHGWDVSVVLDPAAAIPAAELKLLWERIDLIASRLRDGATLERLRPQVLDLRLTDTAQRYSLHLDAELHLLPAGTPTSTGQVSGPAEAVLRLVYGRLQPGDPIEVTGSANRADLTALFPGY